MATTRQINEKEMEELTTHFNKTPEEITQAVRLIFDGRLEDDFKTLQSLSNDKKAERKFAKNFLNNPVKRLAFDILTYYGKGEDN